MENPGREKPKSAQDREGKTQIPDRQAALSITEIGPRDLFQLAVQTSRD
jgi:hypothetical protein